MSKSAIVIGAGIVGLATARALAVRNYDVTIFERNGRATGASVRNFGMLWPIGQPDGELYDRAMLSKSIWKQVCGEANIWHDPVGSLHLAYIDEEWKVLQELSERMGYRNYELLTARQTLEKSGAVVPEGLKGSLLSRDEMIVDPRKAITAIPFWLNEKYGINFFWGKTITDIAYPCVYAAKQQFEADEIYVCSGSDMETLYPEIFSSMLITKCKLQMMRIISQPGNWRIGPALCGGLSLLHYNSFKAASSLPVLRKKMEEEYSEYLRWGIHVMVSQNEEGELTIGDSHEYGLTHDPFDKHFINQMILDYLEKFARFKNGKIIESWNGIYPKLTNGETDLVLQPEPGVTIINGLGGAGMTLSFGLCEQVIGNQARASLKIV
jgi:FAD dependent oxidoreductase TIGR03364